MSRAQAAFIDRDGVVNALVADPTTGRLESPLHVREVALIPGATDALKELRDAGLLLVGVSNQPAAAKGTVSLAELDAVQERVLELVALDGVRFDAFRICTHHPEGVAAELAIACDCRKPAPGMLIDAAHELEIDLARSWMVGDTDGDVMAGAAAGCRTVLVEHPASAHKRSVKAEPDAVATSLESAASLILAHDRIN